MRCPKCDCTKVIVSAIEEVVTKIYWVGEELVDSEIEDRRGIVEIEKVRCLNCGHTAGSMVEFGGGV